MARFKSKNAYGNWSHPRDKFGRWKRKGFRARRRDRKTRRRSANRDAVRDLVGMPGRIMKAVRR